MIFERVRAIRITILVYVQPANCLIDSQHDQGYNKAGSKKVGVAAVVDCAPSFAPPISVSSC